MIDKILKAGEIAKKVREEAKKMIKPGVKLIDVAEFVENRIKELGGEPAFPCNLSINDIAAHYTPSFNDPLTFNDIDLVKLDLGVHVDGYIADTAVTIDLSGKYKELVRASEDALKEVINRIEIPMNIGEMGKIIQETIESYGFKPIANLSGHVMYRYELHTGISIPNVYEKTNKTIGVGDLVAIEPFATDGFGMVKDGELGNIYKFLAKRPIRLLKAKKLLDEISKKYPYLPFAERWVIKDKKDRFILNSLLKANAIYGYPILKEKEGGMVSQAEHTIYITEDKVIVITE
ncbi:methionine aminopeptidase, type II [Methanocaldococcus infernus ME]|uniref:Methionine aminopeptidase n=1 Tax=Methanocaldococcus infernus (strain DSM 11812 / JCM 15783 / ME) TaxID=573063 RepID=D5VST6_METIM|nr:type II methionyl aminopeptidase [Methanocaldococcus infernus]ADG13639.1 methionine aminopeptidase, type II [Methanocaldococcus infernus ME]